MPQSLPQSNSACNFVNQNVSGAKPARQFGHAMQIFLFIDRENNHFLKK